MLLIGSSQVQQWDRGGKPHSGTAPAKRPQFLYPDFLLPVQRKEQRTCGAGPLLLVPVTGLEPVRCRQRRILSGYIDSVFRSNLHSTVPWKR